MPRLLQAVPTLATTRLAESTAFYRDVLAFDVVYADDQTSVLARDDVQILLWACDDPALPRNDACRIRVSEIDALHAHCQSHAAVHPNGSLELKPWGLREFTVLDPCGAALTFYEQGN